MYWVVKLGFVFLFVLFYLFFLIFVLVLCNGKWSCSCCSCVWCNTKPSRTYCYEENINFFIHTCFHNTGQITNHTWDCGCAYPLMAWTYRRIFNVLLGFFSAQFSYLFQCLCLFFFIMPYGSIFYENWFASYLLYYTLFTTSKILLLFSLILSLLLFRYLSRTSCSLIPTCFESFNALPVWFCCGQDWMLLLS